MLTIANHGFNAIRRPGPALALSVARLVLIYLPLAFVASHFFAYLGIFAAIALANVIAGLVAAVWFRKTAGTLAKSCPFIESLQFERELDPAPRCHL